MRKSLVIVALAVSLMAGFAVLLLLEDRESGQVSAAMTLPQVAEGDSSIGLESVNESPTQELLGSATGTGASDPEYRGVGDKADHDGVCPFNDSRL